jgi:hypothetical protein
MATDKKHIAVYLDPAVEQALIAFCERKGLISKKGFMYSAGVNAALAEFFNLADTDAGNIPLSGNTPSKSGNILGNASNTLNDLRNIPATSASNIPAGDNIPLDTGNILTKLDNIPAGDNIPLDTGNILTKLDNIPAGDNIPLDTGNILTKLDNIPVRSASNTPPEVGNIPLKSLVMEVLPGKQKA